MCLSVDVNLYMFLHKFEVSDFCLMRTCICRSWYVKHSNVKKLVSKKLVIHSVRDHFHTRWTEKHQQ